MFLAFMHVVIVTAIVVASGATLLMACLAPGELRHA
jgi:hypothetical protein